MEKTEYQKMVEFEASVKKFELLLKETNNKLFKRILESVEKEKKRREL